MNGMTPRRRSHTSVRRSFIGKTSIEMEIWRYGDMEIWKYVDMERKKGGRGLWERRERWRRDGVSE